MAQSARSTTLELICTPGVSARSMASPEVKSRTGSEVAGNRAGKFVLGRSMVSIVHVYPREELFKQTAKSGLVE